MENVDSKSLMPMHVYKRRGVNTITSKIKQ